MTDDAFLIPIAYDKLDGCYEAFVTAASILIWLA